MVYNVTVNENVYGELSDAFYYYENKQIGLGAKLYIDFTEKIEVLSSTPKYFSFYLNDYRKIRLSSFPYFIIFKIIDDENVLVQSLVQSNINPGLIEKRIFEQ